MLKLIIGVLVFATSTETLAENWMAAPIDINEEGKRAVPLFDRDSIVRTDPTKPFAVHAILYEQPEAKIIQRVWLTQFDCVARTFRITSEETRDVNDKVIEWAQKRYSAIPITRGTVLDYFLEAACYDRWSQRLRAMGKQSNLNLSKALFELP